MKHILRSGGGGELLIENQRFKRTFQQITNFPDQKIKFPDNSLTLKKTFLNSVLHDYIIINSEEMCFAMDTYEPADEDEIPLEVGKILQVKQKNIDGWWLVR